MMEQEIALFCHFRKKRFLHFYPTRRASKKGARGEDLLLGMLGGRVLEIRAFITLAILLRGKKKLKKNNNNKMKWELFMPQAAHLSTESKS